MNLLRTIIERLNQRIEVANIFDKQFSLCELNANGNDKAWVHYISNGQAEVVTNFDAKNGTLFWAKRGKVTINKTDAYKMSGCKQLYITTFPLTAYAIVKKSHLPCDSEDAQDWLASRIYKLASGTDPLFKQSIGVINYEVIPTGYINEIKTLTANYEWACVSVDMDVQVITSSEDGCYDTCATGDIPLPDLQPCTPCLTEVAVDGVTILGNGTPADPLSAIGAGGGAIVVQDEGDEVTPVATTLNFTGEGVTASLTSPGVVEVNIEGGAGVTSVSGTAPIASSGGTTPDISISQADGSTDGYLSATDWNAFNSKGDGTVTSVNSGVNINVDNTDPDNPIINSLADRYKTSSTTSNSVSNGSKNFTVDINLSYIPLQEILVVFNPANHMHGEVTSYNPATGALVVDIKTHTGSGTYTSWVLNLDGTPVDALTGSGTANEIAYFSAARVLASLPVTTYPSLTELSYAKGVTSAIQTQLNAKENVVNKSTSVVTDQASDVKYPSVKALFDWANSVFTTSSAVAAQIAAALVGYATQAWVNSQGFLTAITSGQITSALGFTPVPDSRTITINGTAQNLTANRSWSIPAIVTYKDLNNQTAVTGTTANTKVIGQLIPANTFAVGDIIEIKCRFGKTTSTGLTTLRMYINTADSLTVPAATLIATSATTGGTNNFLGTERQVLIKSATVTQSINAASNLFSDLGNFNGVQTNSNINWAVDQYIIFAIQNAAIGDSTIISYFQITKQ